MLLEWDQWAFVLMFCCLTLHLRMILSNVAAVYFWSANLKFWQQVTTQMRVKASWKEMKRNEKNSYAAEFCLCAARKCFCTCASIQLYRCQVTLLNFRTSVFIPYVSNIPKFCCFQGECFPRFEVVRNEVVFKIILIIVQVIYTLFQNKKRLVDLVELTFQNGTRRTNSHNLMIEFQE